MVTGVEAAVGTLTTENRGMDAAGSVTVRLQTQRLTGREGSDVVDGEAQADQSLNRNQLDDLVSEANKVVWLTVPQLRYVLHDKLHQYYIQLEDPKTHEVLREIPPKKFMDMYAAIAEKLGLIVNKRI